MIFNVQHYIVFSLLHSFFANLFCMHPPPPHTTTTTTGSIIQQFVVDSTIMYCIFVINYPI